MIVGALFLQLLLMLIQLRISSYELINKKIALKCPLKPLFYASVTQLLKRKTISIYIESYIKNTYLFWILFNAEKLIF